MNSALNSLRYAARFLALIGLLALASTEEMTGPWLYGAWLILAGSLIADRYPLRQRILRRAETLAVIVLVLFGAADFLLLKNTFFVMIAHFLMLFQMFKLSGLKERKDCLQIGLIGFFQLLAACTLTADVAQAVLLLLVIPGATALLYWNYAARVAEEIPPQAVWPLRPLKRLHWGINVAALPLNLAMTVIIFVLFPRLTFNLHVPGFGAGRSQYTDQMNLAQNGSLLQDSTVAVWMSFANDTQHAPWNGYLRGDIMDTFDGRQWSNGRHEKIRILQADRTELFQVQRNAPGVQPLRARITLLNTLKNTLFTPGTALQIMAPLGRLDAGNGGDFHWDAVLQRPLQYQILVIPGERADPALEPKSGAAAYLQIPSHGLDRTRALALEVAGRGGALGKARALETYLRTHYRYTLDLGATTPNNPVDAFLFERRAGFCIHFASALAVMLRLNGIPSRVVAGYYHGEWNALAQQILFREKDAHAWVEAWVDHRWITLDPSPRAVSDGELHRASVRWRIRLGQMWDYLGYEWNRAVIQYDLYAQLRFWERMRNTSYHLGSHWLQWRHRLFSSATNAIPQNGEASEKKSSARAHGIKLWSALILGIAAALFLLIGNGYRRRAQAEAPLFYIRFLRRMARAGVEKKPAETAHEFARRAVKRLPKLSTVIHRTTNDYYQTRFAKK